jgi:dihydroorotate dehydrogenase electron transfer subunit
MSFDQLCSTVSGNQCLGGDYYLLTLDCPNKDRLRDTLPGHFAMLRPYRTEGPLLARPMSILSSKRLDNSAQRIEVFYKVHGVGTALLATLHEGETLDYLGPLGQPFPPIDCANVLLVGGGVGIPPLVYWCVENHATAFENKVFFMGGRTENDLFFEAELADAGAELQVATENGARGHQGFVTVPFEAALDTLSGSSTTVLTCGPMAMMQAVARICEARGVRCLASLEAYMACGYGVCLGCVVPTKDGDFVRVCMEGPVMDTCDIDIHSPHLGAL